MIEDSSIIAKKIFQTFQLPNKTCKALVELLADSKMDFLWPGILLKGPGVLWDLFSLNFVNYGFSWFAFTT